MVNVEEISTTAMEIISYAGAAKSCYIEALRAYRGTGLKEYQAKIDEGNKQFSLAHNAHLGILSKEMQDAKPQITMLLAHAEDQLMSAETIHMLIEELVATFQVVQKGGK